MKHLLFILLLPTFILAGGDNSHLGARSAGMGHSSVGLSDVWSTHHNQAGLGWLESPVAGVFFQNKFLLKEMSYMGFAYAHPTKSGAFGVSFSNFGSSLYGESKFGIGYGMKFSEKITGGLQLNYHNTRLKNDYGKHSGVTAEFGIQANLNSKMMLSTHIFNPTRSKLNDYNDERIPTVLRIGINYKFSKQVLATVEAEKNLLNKPVFRAGLEYHTNDMIYLRAGIGTSPTLASFGVGIKKDAYQFDIAASYHQVLGFSPEISFQYTLGKKSESKSESTHKKIEFE